MQTVDLASWLGPRDADTLDPAVIQFTEREGGTCSRCMFNRQWVKTCNKANAEAVKRGLHNCEDGYVYVAIVADTRQRDLIGEAQ